MDNDLGFLYRRAFREFGAMALWSLRPVAQPVAGDALVVARALRQNGNMAARRLAEQIEAACRAAH
ncbi:MAG: hypothetical protein KJZ75_13000 [Hyphomonadaceae bacterium]|nr:hypothetical protein [Hyphomonadaceae bacterium]